MPMTVLINRHGLALQCGRFFLFPSHPPPLLLEALSRLFKIVSASCITTQLVAANTSLFFCLDFHNTQAKRVKV